MTPTPAGTSKAFGPAAIARHWGAHGVGASRQYADKAIRKLGCPTSSLELALAWRTARTGKKIQSGGAEGEGNGKGDGETRGVMPSEITGDSLNACLARARQTEMEQYRIWREAVADKDPGAQERALKNHATAQKNVSDIEEKIFAVRKDRGEYVLLPQAQERIDARLSAFRAAQTAFPRVLALELAPGDAQRVEAKIKALQAAHFNAPLASAARPLVEGAGVPIVSPAPAVESAAA